MNASFLAAIVVVEDSIHILPGLMMYLGRADHNSSLSNCPEELAARHPPDIVQVEELECLEQEGVVTDLV